MINPFEKINKTAKEAYEPDPEVLELVMKDARKIAPESSTEDIRGASVRAMRAAERAGTPITMDTFAFNSIELETDLLKEALGVQMDKVSSGVVVEGGTGQVLGSAANMDEAKRVAQNPT